MDPSARDVVGDIIDALIAQAQVRARPRPTPSALPEVEESGALNEAGAMAETDAIEATSVATDAPSSEDEDADSNASNASADSTMAPAAEQWWRLRRALEEARSLRLATTTAEDDTWARLDAFIREHGEERRAFAGKYIGLVEMARKQREAGLTWLAEERRRQRARREAEEMERQAQAEIAKFQVESERKARELQARLNEAAARKRRLQEPEEHKPRWCYICGMAGVPRSRDCPNRANHYRYRK